MRPSAACNSRCRMAPLAMNVPLSTNLGSGAERHAVKLPVDRRERGRRHQVVSLTYQIPGLAGFLQIPLPLRIGTHRRPFRGSIRSILIDPDMDVGVDLT